MASKEYHREHKKKLISEGKCTSCGKIKNTDNGTVLCDVCREKSIKRNRAKSEKCKQEGICVFCGEHKEPGNNKCICNKCSEKNIKRSKKLRDIYIQNKICINCGKNEADKNSKQCKECKRKDSDYMRAVLKQRIIDGKCVACGEVLKDTKIQKCEDCSKKGIAASNKTRSKRMKNDPAYKFRVIISNKIKDNLKKNNGSKAGKSIKIFLGEDYFLTLKNHLENQFETWMNWDNYGAYNSKEWDDNDEKTWKWNIDHIIPKEDFEYSSMQGDNFKKCWALENLRPYSAKQNVIDGATRVRHSDKQYKFLLKKK